MLVDAKSQFGSPLRRHALETNQGTGTPQSKAIKWNGQIKLLIYSLIRLVEDYLDHLFWSENPTNGEYTTKLGHKVHIDNLSA